MLCKKCGASISDEAKFCTSCGAKVEDTVVVSGEGLSGGAMMQSNPSDGMKPVNDLNSMQNNNTVTSEPKNKKSNAWIFILGGILLGVVAIILLFVSLGSGNNDVRVLEKALSKMGNMGENSGTIKANVSVETDTQDNFDFSASISYAEKNDLYNVALKLNKSLLNEEMNLYSTVTEDDITLYAKSSLIDMLGFTSSPNDIWVNYFMTFDELELELDENDLEDDFNLSKVLDEKHFAFVDEENGLKHYKLTIDNELLNKIKAQADEEDLRELEDSFSTLNEGQSELTDVYYLDVYINKSNELAKVSMELSEGLEEEGITKVVISLEFVDFGRTTVEIPTEVKNSTMNLENYMSTYSSY